MDEAFLKLASRGHGPSLLALVEDEALEASETPPATVSTHFEKQNKSSKISEIDVRAKDTSACPPQVSLRET